MKLGEGNETRGRKGEAGGRREVKLREGEKLNRGREVKLREGGK